MKRSRLSMYTRLQPKYSATWRKSVALQPLRLRPTYAAEYSTAALTPCELVPDRCPATTNQHIPYSCIRVYHHDSRTTRKAIPRDS